MSGNHGNMGVVRGAIKQIAELNDVLADFVPAAFPVGTVVYWKHGTHTRRGIVDMHSGWRFQEVRVQLKTGSTIWIDVTQLLSYKESS